VKLVEIKCPNCGKQNNKEYIHLDLPDDYDMYHDIENENQSNGYISFYCDCGTSYKAIFVYDFVSTEINKKCLKTQKKTNGMKC